jgi:hypothetical protein
VNFFVDNNLPQALAHALHALSQPSHHLVTHLRDHYPSNTPDTKWIEDLSSKEKKERWVIITHDSLNKGLEREALRQAGLLVFFLDKSWKEHKFWDKACQLVRWWPRIIEQAEGIEGGAAFNVKWNFSGKGKFEQIKV